MGFFDIQPLVTSAAHVLVIPKNHYKTIDELTEDPESAMAIGLALPLVVKALKRVLKVSDLNIVQNNGVGAGQVVNHVHFHIVARRPIYASSDGQAKLEDNDNTRFITQALLTGKPDLRKKFSHRLSYAAQVYGRGQRNDLDDNWAKDLSDKLRREISTILTSAGSKQQKLFLGKL